MLGFIAEMNPNQISYKDTYYILFRRCLDTRKYRITRTRTLFAMFTLQFARFIYKFFFFPRINLFYRFLFSIFAHYFSKGITMSQS